MAPPQPPLRLQELLTNADLLVVPSRETPEGDCEGIPNVVLEAFALGTPVVGAAAGGIAEVLDDRTGWLAPPASLERLAEAIAAALDDPAAAAQKARAARRLVEARHDIRSAIAPLLQTIEGGL
jgi:glycosyltransferase involved in cell wall biosynthesis